MRDFRIVDVFSHQPFHGNPVAVILNADGLSGAQMQAIAAWTNLSETTFHLTPTREDADYRLRIFTPRSELPFAGHPTLGSAHALIEAGLVLPVDGRLVQDCKAGPVPIRVVGEGRLRLELPRLETTCLSEKEAARLETILAAPLREGTQPAIVDVGPRWIVAEMADAASVFALTPDLASMAMFETELGATGVTTFGRHPDGAFEIEVRSFAPSDGVPEDPVCGSGNGAVAVYRQARGDWPGSARYLAAQGRCVGRAGEIELIVEPGRISVGGAAVTTVSGRISAP